MYRCYLIVFTALLLAPFTRPSAFQIAREQIDSTAIQRANIRTDDRTILMGTDAVRRGGIKPIDLGPGKTGWIESWSSNNESLTWTAYITRAGKYKVSAILESTGEDCAVEVSVDSKRLDAPCGKRKWNRVTLGVVQLAIGSRTILFRSTGSRPLGKFFS